MICRSLLAEEEGCRYFARFKLHNSCLRFLTTQGWGGPFRYRFFGKQELGSSLARACSLLLSTFALTFFLALPQFGRRENLFRRHDGLRPHLWQESANWQVFRLEEGSQENKSSPLCTTQTTNRWLRRSLFHALACDVLFRQLFWTGHW